MRAQLHMNGRCLVDGKQGTVVGYGFACTTFNGEKDVRLVVVQFDDGTGRTCARSTVDAIPDNTDATASGCPF